MIAQFPLATKGLDTRKLVIEPDRAMNCQNLIEFDGILSRAGNTRFVTGRLSAGNPVIGLHRFYRSGAVPQLIAASGPKVGFRVDADSVWTDIQAGRTFTSPVNMVTWLGRTYITDGDNRPISWDGAAFQFEDFHDSGDAGTFVSTTSFTVVGDRTVEYLSGRELRINSSILVQVEGSAFGAGVTTVTVAPAVVPNPITSNIEFVGIPADVVQLLPYQDRLLGIRKGSGVLEWSGSFRTTSWNVVALTNVQPDTRLVGMTVRSITNTSSGVQSEVLLMGVNGMYVFAGTNLQTPFTAGNYQVAQVSSNLIVTAPESVAWTPKGTMFLTVDKQVYLFPYSGSDLTRQPVPIPVGHRIQKSNGFVSGLHDIGVSGAVSAIYHQGMYKISYPSKGSTVNDLQMWLFVDGLEGRAGDFGPWYGPMKGNSIGPMIVLNGDTDSGQLLGGLDNESDVLELGRDGLTSDFSSDFFKYGDGTVYGKKKFLDEGTQDIFTIYKTFHHPLAAEIGFNKDLVNVEMDLKDEQARAVLTFYDLERILGLSLKPVLGPDTRFRVKGLWNTRNLSVEIKWNSQDFTFRLVGLLADYTTRLTPMEEA